MCSPPNITPVGIDMIPDACTRPLVSITEAGNEDNDTGNVSPTVTDENVEVNGVNEDDPTSTLNMLKSKNVDRPVIAHLNINFLEPKFEGLKSLIKDNVDILLISETKLDDTYPVGQFLIEGYSEPIRLDRNCHGGGLLFYMRSDLPCKELKCQLPTGVEAIFLELTIRKSKWVIVGTYNPHKEKISYFLSKIGNELDKLLPKYENILLLGDSNSAVTEKHLKEFYVAFHISI